MNTKILSMFLLLLALYPISNSFAANAVVLHEDKEKIVACINSDGTTYGHRRVGPNVDINQLCKQKPSATKISFTAEELANHCFSKDEGELYKCYLYIAGTTDAIALARELLILKEGEFNFCLPNNLSRATIIRTVREYLSTRNKSNGFDISAPAAITISLTKAYPCDQSK